MTLLHIDISSTPGKMLCEFEVENVDCNRRPSRRGVKILILFTALKSLESKNTNFDHLTQKKKKNRSSLGTRVCHDFNFATFDSSPV